ncbi:MAG: efflux RND transporter periplasmic adaptor subunit [Lentisphaeria bacterium]|nr:efflux RND transporter periplasmic adaptor subunit [Lentisphaeria bacterium]
MSHLPTSNPEKRGARTALCAAVVLPALLCACGPRVAEAPEETFQVKRGTLDVTVVASGSLEAADSIDINSEVDQNLKILEIVEEGTLITPEDVEKGRILVKLDSTNLEEQLYQRESELESARASLTEASEGLAIQKSENESSIRAAELNVTYARNDLRKLVGDTLAGEVIDHSPENIGQLLDHADLGGQSRQDLRNYGNEIEIARIKVNRAREKVDYTRKLYERQFVSKNELETDELDLRTQENGLQSAEAKLEIFRRYDFVKDFQKTWATLLEAQEKLAREQAVARSRLAQAEAKLRSRESEFDRSKQRLSQLKDNIGKCTIQARQPGLVVYPASPPWQNTGPLREGSEIRPRQTIFKLPDLSHMMVVVKIHEAQIDAVSVGQKATVSVEALPGRAFTGEVTKKAVMPSGQSRWLNPELKEFEVNIRIAEEDTALRPGITATVEILAERLENVLHVPIQSVATDEKGRHTVYRNDGTAVPVTVGKRNQVFVAVAEGLSEGEAIRLTPPSRAAETHEESP